MCNVNLHRALTTIASTPSYGGAITWGVLVRGVSRTGASAAGFVTPGNRVKAGFP
jgi:hypothetical protein